MERAGPLVPVPVLAGIILLALAAIVIAARPAVRVRWPRLLPEIGAFSGLALIHLLFFWQPYRSAAQVPAGGGDLVSFFYPLHAFAAREFQNGNFPFWNPHQYSGMPHLANFQTGALYPPNLIAYLLSDPFSYAALERVAILHFLLASAGAYWLGRALGQNRLPSVLAGAVFAYSGFLVAHLGHYSMLATASWAPFVFAAIVAATRRQSWPIALAGTLALALCVLGGHQPVLLMVLTAALVLALFELWRARGFLRPAAWRVALRDKDFLSDLARYAFMALVALGLTLPSLGPSFEMAARASRSELSYEAASEFAVEPLALIHLVAPTVFGSNPTDYWGAFSSGEVWGYTGVVALLLAAYGVAARPCRTRVFWLAVALVALIYMLGPFAPLHGWAYAFIPGYDRIRAAGRAFLFFDLAVALLAGFGLQALVAGRATWESRQESVTWWGLRGIVLALAAVVLFVIPLFASLVLRVDDPSNRPMIALNNVNLLALWLGLALAAGLVAYRGWLAGGTLAAGVIALALVDLFHATAPFNPTTAPILAGFQYPEIVGFLEDRQRADGPFRIDARAANWQPDAARLYGLDDIAGLADPLALEDYERYLALARSSPDLYRTLNTRFILLDEGAGPPLEGAREVMRSGGITVWELDSPLPRAWFQDRPEEPVAVEVLDSDRLRINLPSGTSGGLLVVSQTYYPGWRAEIDGDEASVTQYQGALQAIMIPEGASEVALTFEPRFWTGWIALAVASLVVWLLAAALVARAWRRDRRTGKTG